MCHTLAAGAMVHLDAQGKATRFIRIWGDTAVRTYKESADRFHAPRFACLKSESGEDDLVAFLEGHDGLFPIRRLAGLRGALAARLAADVQRVDLGYLDLEQFLHCVANLRLVRATVGDHRVLIVLLALARALLGQPDSFDNFK